MQVLNHCIQIETREFLGIVESLVHRIGYGGVLMENMNVQLVWPPITVRPRPTGLVSATPARYRACIFVCHVSSLRSLKFTASPTIPLRHLSAYLRTTVIHGASLC